MEPIDNNEQIFHPTTIILNSLVKNKLRLDSFAAVVQPHDGIERNVAAFARDAAESSFEFRQHLQEVSTHSTF
jgi:hypothetical protein